MLEDLGFSDVAGVDDPFTSFQGSEGFGAEQAMGIGDDANFHSGLQSRLKPIGSSA
ncbi:hypothetical protein D3C85_1662720 [compost metagenome]